MRLVVFCFLIVSTKLPTAAFKIVVLSYSNKLTEYCWCSNGPALSREFYVKWFYDTATLGPVLLLRHYAVARILANGMAAFFESCAAIG